MKKLLVALPVLAGTAWAGTSYFAGVQSESIYDQFLTQTDAMKPFVFEKESFDKGLTTSHAVSIVKESSSPDAEVLFRLQHDINHSSVQMDDAGPAIGTATIRTTLVDGSINPKYEHIRDYFQSAVPLEIVTKAGIGGSVSNKITVSAAEIPVEDGSQTWSLAESVVTITSDQTRSTGEGTIGAATLTDDEGNKLITSPSQLTFNMANQKSSISDYEFLLNTDEFTVEPADVGEPVKATGIQLATSSKTNNDQIDYNITFDVGNIDMGALMPADSAPVTSGKLVVDFNNMRVKALEEFNNYYGQFSLSERSELGDDLPAEFLSEYAKIITKDAELSYDLALENSAGKANADVLLRFIGDSSESGKDNIVTGVDLGNALEVDANIVADKAALELTPAIMFMQSPPAQMVFVDEGDQYVAKATVRQLVADLNGQIFPLNEMSGGMLEIPLEDLMQMGGPF